MKHAFRNDFGRPDTAAPVPVPQDHDKWELLQSLTDAAEAFELGHRTLGVLKALLTFHPERRLSAVSSAIVFASNRALSDRLSGMPESTLRRHLAALVAAGVIARQDSPNRKRFARRAGKNQSIAFGFDLRPLAALGDRLKRLADEARQHAANLEVLRQRLMQLRARMIEKEGQGPLADEAALILRRKPREDALLAMIGQLEETVDIPHAEAPATREMSACDDRNERHKQNSDENDFDSERAQAHEQMEPETVSLAHVLAACPAFTGFFPEKVTRWLDLHNISHRLAMMLGIEPPVLDQARRIMGKDRATVVILCMLERIDRIRKPGAYLRALTQKAEKGQFRVSVMLRALESPAIVS